MLLAQALGEYGGLSSLAASFQSWLNRAEDMLAGLGTTEYIVIGVVVAAFVLFGRRRT
jgi:hypothetical protein